MKRMIQTSRRACSPTIALGALFVASIAAAADPYPQPQAYPQPGYPQQAYPQSYPDQSFQQPVEQHPMRALFANSLAQVAQTTGSAAVVMLADGLTGSLKNWFDARRQRKQAKAMQGNFAPQGAAPSNYPMPGGAASGYPAPSYPSPAADPNGYPTPGASGDPTGYPAPNAGDMNGYPAPASTGSYPTDNYPPAGGNASSPPLYAGIAYEIHKLQADGSTLPVDPASYSFHTGEQFNVYYRPSLPGRVDVFNINAAGQQSQIDSSIIAAGELATLGPYEFALMQGQETLILRLTPCATPATYAVTRNIIKAPSAPSASPSNAFGFSDCNSTTTRGIRTKTRDIRKVSTEGGTSFALDPLGANELGGGDMAPRQITITLMHR